MQLTGGQALARQLVAEGVTDLFGIPGVQLDWAVDGLRQVANHIRYVVPRHEQAAAFMADGYARTTGPQHGPAQGHACLANLARARYARSSTRMR